MTTIALGTGDVEILARLVVAEAGNIEQDYIEYYENIGMTTGEATDAARRLAFGTIIDQIINRVAAGSAQYGTSLEDVVNRNSGGVWQYSAVRFAQGGTGETWDDLPDVDSAINDFVSAHLAARANGEPSLVGAATHYYNPYISSPVWGPDLQGTSDVGIGSDTHFFGSLPATDPLPNSYTLAFGGDSSGFVPFPPIPGRKPGSEALQPDEASLPGWVAGVTTAFHTAELQASPIVLDIDASGTIELAALNGLGSVYWDIDNDGFREASGWITGGDGLLCIDLNSDGIIAGQNELFGNTASYANGYLALDAYDTSNDNAITSADTDFGDFLVWIDTNADGYSQSGELHSLASLSITSISTSYSDVNYTISGNTVKQQSTFVMNGNSYQSVDAWFTYDNVNTEYSTEFTLDARTLLLPDLRGYGTLPDLHIAMSMDEALLQTVEAFAQQTAATMLGVGYDIDGKVRDIMHRWAGVQNVNPTGRGSYIDGRDLAFLEKFMGEAYVQVGAITDPNAVSHSLVAQAWHSAFEAIKARLLLQTDMASIYDTEPVYNSYLDTIAGPATLDLATVESLVDVISLSGHNHLAWAQIFQFLDDTIGLANLTTGDVSSLNTLVQQYDTDNNLSYTILKDMIQAPSTSNFAGNGNNNIMYGLVRADSMVGGAGNDILKGLFAGDVLSGGDGNDVLLGGQGADNLSGNLGNDTYVILAGDGYDLLTEALNGGIDTIIWSGVNPDDVRSWNDGYGELTFQATPTDRVILAAPNASESFIHNYYEKIVFDNGVVWDLTQGLHLINLDDTGQSYGSSMSDKLEGRGGNDNLKTLGGNDILIGGTGNDHLEGGAGNDDYEFSPGDGSDLIQEALAAGTDRVLLHGVNPTDVRRWTDGYGDLTILYTATDQLVIAAPNATENFAYNHVERIVFDDATVWDLTQGYHLVDTNDTRTLFGTSMVDTLEGRGGNDALRGYGGADILIGGIGNDNLEGGIGNDDYVFAAGDGTDLINEALSSGLDRIVLHGVNPGDVRLWTDQYGELNILYTATDLVAVNAPNTTESVIYNYVERIVFDDATVWDLTQGLNLIDTDDSHNLYGTSMVDTLQGRGGSDQLFGNGGNDVLYGGAGQDNLNGGAGADRYVFESASAFLNVDGITGFSLSDNDKIDLVSLLGEYDPLTEAITDFVQITTSSPNSSLFVDRDGTGSSYGFTQIANIYQVTGLTDEAALVASGHLIVS